MIFLSVLGNLWGSVNTLAGLLAWLTSWSRFERFSHGAIVLRAGGWAQWFMGKAGVAAFTWGAFVLVNSNLVSVGYLNDPRGQRLLRHEAVHVLQSHLFGPFLLFAYGVGALVALIRGEHPYRDNALEKWAYAWEVRT